MKAPPLCSNFKAHTARARMSKWGEAQRRRTQIQTGNAELNDRDDMWLQTVNLNRNRNCNRSKRRKRNIITTRSPADNGPAAAPPPPGPQLGRDGTSAAAAEKSASVHVQSRAPSPASATASDSGDCQTAAAARRGTAFINRQGRSRRGSASLRRADAAQVCNNVGFFFVDGAFECSSATAARQIVSERW